MRKMLRALHMFLCSWHVHCVVPPPHVKLDLTDLHA